MADYITTDTELTSIANAIRTKGGTSASLVYPSGFVSAINNIPSGGGGGTDVEDGIIMGTLSGAYENSRVTKIAAGAFELLSELTSVNFPNVTEIGNSAFRYCSSLSHISFPSCISISMYAFYSTNIIEAFFSLCTTLETAAFYNCTNLSSIYFPVCEGIPSNVFRNCYSLISVSFPQASYIGSYAFYSCDHLSYVSFSSCEVIYPEAFRSAALESVFFPICHTIGSTAFQNCFQLSMASFPACTYISSQAFYGCSNLLSLYLLGSQYASLYGTNAFTSTPLSNSTYVGQYGSIFVKASMLSSWKTMSYWSYYSSRFVGLTDEEIADLEVTERHIIIFPENGGDAITPVQDVLDWVEANEDIYIYYSSFAEYDDPDNIDYRDNYVFQWNYDPNDLEEMQAGIYQGWIEIDRDVDGGPMSGTLYIDSSTISLILYYD